MKWTLKVWGGAAILRGLPHAASNVRVIVAEYTQKAAVARLNKVERIQGVTSLYYFRGFFSLTGNQQELIVARRPGVWWSKDWGNTIKELKA